ncbi:uncharacterized protein KY384_000647 [Bacidia gigantensis]|uniref:uncharacterized protein n=1 Tax=Bacidia gigantensis TaxID=2732470 RepID=UPI001D040F75|nr:uncharacterized protein KY384_000647 [Bacidia gigantensis]KAG8525887.1 hypothetical protein KY384_000647 [Bacidia gigantensis]
MATTAAAQSKPTGNTIVAEPDRPVEPWRENLNNHLICRDCKEFPPNLVEEHASGDTVCSSCGLVLGDRTVDTRSEWRTFSNDDQGGDDPSRVGDAANPLLNGSQLQTGISFNGGNPGRNRDLQRAQNKANHNKTAKALLSAYKEIDAFCESLSIPKSIADTAKGHFKEVYEAGAFRGKSQETIIAGVIFIACRQMKAARTFREIFTLTKVSKAEIGRVFKALEKFFNNRNAEKMKQSQEDPSKIPMHLTYLCSALTGLDTYHQPPQLYEHGPSTDPKQLCERYCNALRLPFAINKVSREIAEKMDSEGMLAGRSPLSVAAACIFMASHLMGVPKTAKEISTVAGVSDGTIRNAYKIFYPDKEKLISPEWLEKKQGGYVGDIARLPVA